MTDHQRTTNGHANETDSNNSAVSITLNYVLVLGISVVLVSGLLLAGGNFVEDQRERVIESELTVIGHHIAGDLEQVDRMVQAGENTERAKIDQSFQLTVSGTGYDVTLEENPDRVVLTSVSPEVTVEVFLNVKTEIDPGDDRLVTGGDFSVEYDPDSNQLVILDG